MDVSLLSDTLTHAAFGALVSLPNQAGLIIRIERGGPRSPAEEAPGGQPDQAPQAIATLEEPLWPHQVACEAEVNVNQVTFRAHFT